jgi:hypothetical protein
MLSGFIKRIWPENVQPEQSSKTSSGIEQPEQLSKTPLGIVHPEQLSKTSPGIVQPEQSSIISSKNVQSVQSNNKITSSALDSDSDDEESMIFINRDGEEVSRKVTGVPLSLAEDKQKAVSATVTTQPLLQEIEVKQETQLKTSSQLWVEEVVPAEITVVSNSLDEAKRAEVTSEPVSQMQVEIKQDTPSKNQELPVKETIPADVTLVSNSLNEAKQTVIPAEITVSNSPNEAKQTVIPAEITVSNSPNEAKQTVIPAEITVSNSPNEAKQTVIPAETIIESVPELQVEIKQEIPSKNPTLRAKETIPADITVVSKPPDEAKQKIIRAEASQAEVSTGPLPQLEIETKKKFQTPSSPKELPAKKESRSSHLMINGLIQEEKHKTQIEQLHPTEYNRSTFSKPKLEDSLQKPVKVLPVKVLKEDEIAKLSALAAPSFFSCCLKIRGRSIKSFNSSGASGSPMSTPGSQVSTFDSSMSTPDLHSSTIRRRGKGSR